ncbi:MAG: SpoIIE family protein phosphatase [Bacteroidales bacterium]|nr:SpoIIE family protein phosphatase [Bacteroidales bacterium]
MKKIFSLVSLFAIVYILPAQEGSPLLTHFKESREIENQNWAICQDVNHVMMFANRKGILSFDGQNWLSIRMPVIPFSMQANPDDGKIFVGGDNNFGFLEEDQKGSYKYVSLSGDSLNVGVITKITFTDSLVWFYGDRSVSRYNLKDGKLELCLKSKENYPFTGIIVTPKNTFINVMDKGLYRLESDTLFPIVTGYLTEDIDVLFSLPYNKNMVLVGLGDGKLYLFDGIKYYNYQIKDGGYLKDNLLSDGIVFNDNLYAFSTLEGGALVVDKVSGKVRFTINNQNDLPDDEIFSIGNDSNGGLWLSHQYGLTRADLNLPVENFSIYPGLKGNLITSLWYNNELYVATSEGVFYLAEVKKYTSTQVLVKNKQEKSEPEQFITKEPVTEIPETEKQSVTTQELKPGTKENRGSGRKNIFAKIFGRKTEKKTQTAAAETPAANPGAILKETPGLKENISTTKIPGPVYTKKTISKLRSINYVFKKVDSFDEKCRQLVSTNNGILAATNRGLFSISNHKAILVANDHYVNFISWQPWDDKYYIAADNGYFRVKYLNGRWLSENIDPAYVNPVYSIITTSSNTIWLGGSNLAIRADLSVGSGAIKYTPFSVKSDFQQRYSLDFINDSVILYTEDGMYCFDDKSEKFNHYRYENHSPAPKIKYIYPISNMPWVKYGDDWIYLNTNDKIVEKQMELIKLFNDVISINVYKNILWVIDGENRLYKVDLNKSFNISPEIDVFVKSIKDDSGNAFDLTNVVFNRGDNSVNFDIVAPGYLKKNTTQYQYKISKLMSDWSQWSVRTNYNLLVPDPGEYTLQVRAKDLWGNIGEPRSIKFTIKATFTQTTTFYVLLIFIALLLIFLVFRFRELGLHKRNKMLEDKVTERTAEIESQKQEITSSIEYASRIQMAMLPAVDHFKNTFPDYFIIFKPRNIVSGDFYWIGEDAEHVFFTVADCTGHGVPGAFMSTLGISTLNDIIKNNENLQANTVLKLLRDKIKTSLHQTGKEGEAKDGMDIAFCALSKNRKILQYSGAYNPLFVFQDGEFKEYKADRMPIGIYYGEKEAFTNFEINVKKGDEIYVFSDGLPDQFGGPEGAKYKKSNLKKLLSSIHDKPMEEQKKLIEIELENWKGSFDQVDDITIIGVRI